MAEEISEVSSATAGAIAFLPAEGVDARFVRFGEEVFLAGGEGEAFFLPALCARAVFFED
jgi:hypothetical protein